MNPKAWGGAVGAAILGALAWGAIAAFAHVELGIVAWGIGAAVGAAARMLGSEGQPAGISCAVLALVSIMGGKVVAANFGMEGQVREAFEEQLSPSLYAEEMADAEAYPVSPSDEQLARFMIDHGYTEAPAPEEIGADELASFREEDGPYLEDLRRRKPTLEQWKDEHVKRMSDAFLAQYTFADRIKDSLGVLDILFVLLGVASAYKLGSGQG